MVYLLVGYLILSFIGLIVFAYAMKHAELVDSTIPIFNDDIDLKDAS